MTKTLSKLLLLTLAYISLTISITVHADGIELLKKHNCASCHALTGPAPSTLAEIWQRKAPDLFYAGNKYRQEWLEAWLQNPKRIRPTGMFYMDHIKPGEKRNMVDASNLTKHVKLNATDAKAIASALVKLKTNTALIKAEKHDSSISPGPLGEMLFDKIYGCMACHQIEPGYGGLSGPEIYTAGKRLTPEFMLSYIRSPQAWDPKIWMPNGHVKPADLQKIVNYLVLLSKEDFNASK
jgi:cytochrome c2